MKDALRVGIVIVAVTLCLAAGCASRFYGKVTGVGIRCADMPLIKPDEAARIAEYRRGKPIMSATEVDGRSLPEHEESLRRVACDTDGDAVIDVRVKPLPSGGYQLTGYVAVASWRK